MADNSKNFTRLQWKTIGIFAGVGAVGGAAAAHFIDDGKDPSYVIGALVGAGLGAGLPLLADLADTTFLADAAKQ